MSSILFPREGEYVWQNILLKAREPRPLSLKDLGESEAAACSALISASAIDVLLDALLLEGEVSGCHDDEGAQTLDNLAPIQVLRTLKRRQAQHRLNGVSRTATVSAVDWQSNRLVSVDVDFCHYGVALGLANAAMAARGSEDKDRAKQLLLMAGNALLKAAETEPNCSIQCAMVKTGHRWRRNEHAKLPPPPPQSHPPPLTRPPHPHL